MDEKWLGKRLQAARQAAGLTQQGLCQKANLSYSTLAKIERGAIKAPSIFTVQCIAQALGITLDELVGQRPQVTNNREKQRSKSGIRFVYFDINGCLIRFYQRAFVRLAEVSGQSPDTIESAFWHYNDQVCRGEMSLVDFNTALAQRLHMESLDWITYYLDAVEPMPEMAELVSWVSRLYGFGLLTNVMPGVVDALRNRGLIPDLAYDAIIDSSVVHTIKPEPRIYEIAGQKTGCAPNEILLVDDSRANLMAADKFGWHVLWFDDYRSGESAAKIREALEPLEASSGVNFTSKPAEAPVPA